MSSNPAHVAGGHKATLNNPNASDDAKQHSRQVLDGELSDVQSSTDSGDKNPGNVAGGLKGTLKNPNVSDEAKQSAQERLEAM